MDGLRHEELVRALPYVRRYARAVAGSQQSGDKLVAESLKEILSGGEDNPNRTANEQRDARHALYQVVTRRFDLGSSASPEPAGKLSLKQRQLLLLTQLEEVPVADASAIVGLDVDQATHQLALAREHLRDTAATDVLIIEDEPSGRELLASYLQPLGIRTEFADTAGTGIALARRIRPDAITLDLMLPGQTGWRVIRRRE